MGISQNTVINQFSLHSRDISGRDNGFSDFHTLLPGRAFPFYTLAYAFINRGDLIEEYLSDFNYYNVRIWVSPLTE